MSTEGLLGFEEVRRDMCASAPVVRVPESGVLKLKMELLIDAHAQGENQPWAGVRGELWVSDESEQEFRRVIKSDWYESTWESPRARVFWKCEIRSNYQNRTAGHQCAKYATERMLTTAERQLMRFIAEKVLKPEQMSALEKITVEYENGSKAVIQVPSSPADETRAAVEAENRKKLDRRLNYPW